MGTEVIVNKTPTHRDDDGRNRDIKNPRCPSREPIQFSPGQQRGGRHNWPKQIAALVGGQTEENQPKNKPAEKKSLKPPRGRFGTWSSPDAPQTISAQ